MREKCLDELQTDCPSEITMFAVVLVKESTAELHVSTVFDGRLCSGKLLIVDLFNSNKTFLIFSTKKNLNFLLFCGKIQGKKVNLLMFLLNPTFPYYHHFIPHHPHKRKVKRLFHFYFYSTRLDL